MIPKEAIKLAINWLSNLFLSTFNACLTEGHLSARWKRALLVFLYKGQHISNDALSSYRLISLLDGVGKLFERLLLGGMENHIDVVRAINDRQFGFRHAWSTTDAIAEVIQTARDADKGAVQNRDLCDVVTLDVKNAFNSAPWVLRDAALQRSSVPMYLIKIF